MRPGLVVVIAVWLALAAAATAPAQAPSPSAPAPAGVPAPAPTPAVRGALRLTVEKVGRRRTVLAGARWRVRGTLRPYVAGQTVVVRYYRHGKKLLARRVVLRRRGARGEFVTGFAARGTGRVRVRASHAATPGLKAVRAQAPSVEVLPRTVTRASSPRSVRALQRRLSALGYVVGRRGSYDARTQRAVLAFRKVSGMARTSSADTSVLRRVAAGKGAFRVKYPGHGRHVEADISRQVVALVGAGGKVERIYPTSTGAPSTPTILGSFRIYRKDLGTNALGMVDAAYFIGGYAIHGYRSVPTYNASHGCLRVPVPDARSIYGWVRYGTRVDTYP